MKTLRINSINSDYSEIIIRDKITRLSKGNNGGFTYIHLINGEIIPCEDSINTLEAKLNSD